MDLFFSKNRLVNNNNEVKIANTPIISNNGSGGVKSIEEIRKEMSQASINGNLKQEPPKVEIVDKQMNHRDRVNSLNNILKK